MKRFHKRAGFHAEMVIFEMIARKAADCDFLPHTVNVDEECGVILIRPMVRQCLADVAVSTALVWKVLQAVCTVLPFMHEHGFVHGDISPYNILMDDAHGTVVINDFSCSFPIGTVLHSFCGTPDYASDALGIFLPDDPSVQISYQYLARDDHKSFFLTMLSKYWPSSSSASSCKPHLPWSNFKLKSDMTVSKMKHIAYANRMIFTDKLRSHVGGVMFAFLLRWFQLVFLDEYKSDAIIAHLRSFADVVGSAAVVDDGAHDDTLLPFFLFFVSVKPSSVCCRLFSECLQFLGKIMIFLD